MTKHLNIYMLIVGIGMIYSSCVSAFPFPSPLPGKDAYNLAMDKIENLTATYDAAQQKLATLKKLQEQVKTGGFGKDAIKGYLKTAKSLDFSKVVPDLKMPDFLGKNVNNSDNLAANVEKNLIPVYDEAAGNHSVVAKQQNIKRTEMQQNAASTLFAHAFVTRVTLDKERKAEAPDIDTTNTREIIQAKRALQESMMKRYNDILFMMAQMQEYEAGQDLMKLSVSVDDAGSDSNASGKGGV